MTILKAHHVRSDDTEHACTVRIASVHPASPESVALVARQNITDPDGRSQFMWVRLSNGDLILGVYPQGDTYFAVEHDAQYPR